MRHEEDTLQEAVCKYLDLQYPNVLYFAIPNGEARPTKTNAKGQKYCPAGARLRKLGQKRGVPDLQICRKSLIMPPNGMNSFYHSLFIELKVKGGKVSDHQKAWLAGLEREGYCAKVAYDLDSAIKIITDYLR